MVGTFWAFVPAIIAIVLALITKQVYVSLFLGIFIGAMFLAGGNPVLAMSKVFETMSSELGDNATILVFLVMLGILVVLMTKAGGTKAYGEWASSKIKTRSGAMLSTAALGMLIFVDDYFNCLTVGNVMRPLTDKHRISRAKLAYLIDSTAAPICIIAPISSWAAAVSGEVEGNGLIMFIKTIPFNLYALLTIAMVILLGIFKFDMFKMKRNEVNAIEKGDLLSGETDLPCEETGDVAVKDGGKVIDLVLPIVFLIIFCVASMIFTGYYYNWDTGICDTSVVQSHNLLDAFANCNAGLSLAIGSTFAVFATALMYLPRKVMTFKDFTESFVSGFKSMVSAIFILTFAWTLSSICSALELDVFVKKIVDPNGMAAGLLPAIFFIIAIAISFATGTSWGTFGILIPIATSVLGTVQTTQVVIAISAILAGSVCGDHISPISDTTILASSGAQCNHVDHVNTQLPYALIVAGISLVAYIVSGLIVQTNISYAAASITTLVIGAVLLGGTFCVMYFVQKKKGTLLSQIIDKYNQEHSEESSQNDDKNIA